jgi:hypothetical protein
MTPWSYEMPSFFARDQRYWFTGESEPYTTQDGREITLNYLTSACAECESLFVQKSPGGFDSENLSRRCSDCAKPGVRVKIAPRAKRARSLEPTSEETSP